MAFAGDWSVHVASVVLSPHVTQMEQLRERLMQLRQTCPPPPVRARIGFVVVCTARGSHIWNAEGVESRLFHELFPDCPLAGFFGNGEFGNTVLYAQSQSESQSASSARASANANACPYKSRDPAEPTVFSYTTVFAVLTVI